MTVLGGVAATAEPGRSADGIGMHRAVEKGADMQRHLVAGLSLGLAATMGFAIAAFVLAGPAANAAGSAAPIVVCSSCRYMGMPDIAHTVFLDPNTGEIWAYSNAAMAGQTDPIRVGKLVLGKRVQK